MKFTTKDGFEVDTDNKWANLQFVYRIVFNEPKAQIQNCILAEVTNPTGYYWFRKNAEKAIAEIEACKAKKVYTTKDGYDIDTKSPWADVLYVYRKYIAEKYLKAEDEQILKGGTVSGPQIAMVGDDPNRKETVTPGEWLDSRIPGRYPFFSKEFSDDLHDAIRLRSETFKKLAADKEHARIKSIVDFVDAQQLEFNTANAVVYAMTGKSKAELEKAVWYLQRAIAKL